MTKNIRLPYTTLIKGVWYYRRRGGRAMRIEGDPGSPKFLKHYDDLKNGTPLAPTGRTIADLIKSYKASRKFASKAPRTRRDYDAVMMRLEAALGYRTVDKFERPDIIRLRDDNRDRVRLANYAVQVMSILFEHAKDVGMLKKHHDNPAKGVSLLKSEAPPREPWPPAKIAEFRATIPTDDRTRLLFELLIGTGQRIGDVLKMQWGDIKDGGIQLRTNKTGARLWVPIGPDVQKALDAAQRRNLTILTNHAGKGPWSYRGAADAMMKARVSISAEKWDIHGLRHAAASEMATAGCSDELIASAMGMSVETVRRYTATVRQKVRAIHVQDMREKPKNRT